LKKKYNHIYNYQPQKAIFNNISGIFQGPDMVLKTCGSQKKQSSRKDLLGPENLVPVNLGPL
jgi:hypothetical protein